MKIINGKEISNKYKEELKEKIDSLKSKLKLVVIQVGNNEASNVYVSKKEQLCKEMNIDFELLKFDNISENELLKEINELNNDETVTSILVQLPLPKEINETKIIEAINYKKDVDGLNSINIGKLYSKEKSIVPCTALGIIKLLESSNVSLEGKKVTIIGRTKLVGIPLMKLLLDRNCTISMCHSKTMNLKEYTKNSDIIVVAVGKKNLIKKNMIKKDVILIDVGITRENNKLYGDVDYNNCFKKCSMIAPVPGGVGPMTVIMLINNIIECYELQK